jgi:hypothetical protein
VPFVSDTATSTASRLTSVTIAKRPSVWGGTAMDIDLIWVKREAEYFCKPDWTGQIRLIRLNKFRHARKRFPDPAAKLYVD